MQVLITYSMYSKAHEIGQTDTNSNNNNNTNVY